jgi:hypothetical protein
MNEGDVVDQVQFSQKNGARQAVEIAAGHQTELCHGLLPDAGRLSLSEIPENRVSAAAPRFALRPFAAADPMQRPNRSRPLDALRRRLLRRMVDSSADFRGA